MIIRALRVAECGRFDQPVAIEGLTGGLDLLVGPNEAGKSTLVRALKACLFQKHRSTHRDLSALRPYRGGAPLIEVELEIGAARWRVRKRFLADRMAEVASLDRSEIARGADAEALLERLVGADGNGDRFGLVWMGQGATLQPPDPDAGGTLALRALIEGEIAAAHGAGRLRGIKAAVTEAIGELVSAHRGQRRGRALSLHRASEAAVLALERARADFGEAEALIARLNELDTATAEHHGAAAHAARLSRLATAEAALVAARDVAQQREVARTRVAEARTAANSAAQQLTALAGGLERLEKLEAIATNPGEDAARGARSIELEAGLERARSEARAAQLAEAALGAKVAAATAWRRWHDLAERQERVRQLEAEAEVLAQSCAGAGRDQANLAVARRLTQHLRELTARLDAASVRITVAYQPGAPAIIGQSGEPLVDGSPLTADRPVVLLVPGIGRLSIEPGTSAERHALQTEAVDAGRKLADVLSEADVPDVATFETVVETAARAREARSVIAAEVRVLAPLGRASLEQRLAEAAEALHRLGVPIADDAELQDASALEAALASARVGAERTAAELMTLERAWDDLQRDVAVAVAARAERARERQDIEAGLPPVAERTMRLEEARERVRASDATLDEALRLLSAWEARVTGARMLEAAEAEVAAARAEIVRDAAEAARARAERAHVEGALEALRREDVAERLAVAEGEAQAWVERLADIDDELAALQLLAEELSAEEQRAGDLYSKPVADRLAPLLDIVFPGASLSLDRDYRVAGFARAGRIEDLLRLSDGTREQIAVLVRLAFARLLADRGQGVPLILDDALVFADDERIRRMHRVLEMGANAHQVIILSCREQAFAELRGSRVTLRPWDVKPG